MLNYRVMGLSVYFLTHGTVCVSTESRDILVIYCVMGLYLYLLSNTLLQSHGMSVYLLNHETVSLSAESWDCLFIWSLKGLTLYLLIHGNACLSTES